MGPNMKIAIVGYSGSGKSDICHELKDVIINACISIRKDKER